MLQPVIFCPLSIERSAIARALNGRARIVTTGPGPDAVRAAVEHLNGIRPPLVVLFGLAGGLRDDAELAPRIGSVMDKDARSWTCPAVAPGEGRASVAVGVDEPVTHPARKRQMGTAYGAAIVDCESHAFAAAAQAAGLRWAIVRGISDGVNVRLPAHATDWVDSEGRTRLGGLLLSIARNPAVLPAVIMLGRRTRPALRAAKARLLALLDAERAAAAAPTVKAAAPPRVPRSGIDMSNPIEVQLGRKSARLNDPPPAKRAPRP